MKKTTLLALIAAALAPCVHAQPSNPAWVEAQSVLDRNQKAREHRTVIEKLDGIDAKVSSSQDYDAYAELLEKHKALMAKYNELVEKFNSQVEVVRYLNNRVKELEKSR